MTASFVQGGIRGLGEVQGLHVGMEEGMVGERRIIGPRGKAYFGHPGGFT